MTYNNRIEEMFDEIFVKNAPFQLPKGLKSFFKDLVRYLTSFGGLVILISLWGGVRTEYLPYLLLSAVSASLYIVAFPSLIKNQKHGWDLIFYGQLAASAAALIETIRASNFLAALVGFVINFVITYYVLFQIREYFTEK